MPAFGIFADLQMTSPVLILPVAAHIVGMPALVGHPDDCIWFGQPCSKGQRH